VNGEDLEGGLMDMKDTILTVVMALALIGLAVFLFIVYNAERPCPCEMAKNRECFPHHQHMPGPSPDPRM